MKLYYMEGACSLAPHLVLEELGIPYEAVLVSRDRGDLDKPDFLKLNPMGAVPVLVLDDGKPLTENVAILPYLADLGASRAGGKKLIPAAGTLDRVRCMEWLGFLATEVHKPFGFIFGAQGFAGNKPELADSFRQRGQENASRVFDVVESKLPASGFAFGSDYSIVDAYLFVFFSWAKYSEFDLSRWPKYSALAARIAERPASQRVLKTEDLLD